MSGSSVYIGIKQHLSRRLLPLAAGMGVLIALLAPATYVVIEQKSVQHLTDLYAGDLAAKLQDLALEAPELWKYQTYKFADITRGFHPALDLIGFGVLDEKGTPIAGYSSNDVNKMLGKDLSLGEDLLYTKGTAPIVFNNRRVGTVEIFVSDNRLKQNTYVLFCISSAVGVLLAFTVFRFPVRVVGRMEESLAEVIDALQKSERKYRSLVNNIPDVTWTADNKGNTLFLSPNLPRVYGFTPDEVCRDPSLWFGRIHPEDLERVKDAFVSLFLEGGTFDVEYRIRRKDGEWIWLHDRAVGTYERGGELLADGLFTDVTEHKQVVEKLAEQSRELARSNAELEQFAYVASHDLQEPLRMVSSYMQLLSRRYKGKLDEDADEFIAYAVDGANRMQRLINDLLAYSRVGSKGKEPQPIDCNDVMRQALDNLQEAVREAAVEIVVSPLPTIMGDEVQLMQLFQNLIGNAIKFHGDDPPRVEVGAEARGADWLFSVHDNGIGIEAKNFERIFQIFQRLHDRSHYPGTGIGLAVCKKIVERHHGTIWLESEPGKGTTFHFTIPAMKVSDDLKGGVS
ncbi:MAG TPA: ATP-binding protein [Geobacteraceae bacterium]